MALNDHKKNQNALFTTFKSLWINTPLVGHIIDGIFKSIIGWIFNKSPIVIIAIYVRYDVGNTRSISPSSSHIEVPYDLEQLRVYTMSYHLISLDHQYDGVVDLPHHVDLYINPIQSWVEVACMSTYKFGKNFYDIVHAYDLPSIPPLLNYCCNITDHMRLPIIHTKT